VFFQERLAEVDAHLELLEAMELSAQGGAPRFERVSTSITGRQQKILYSTVYLQLYNLVEATMSRCIEAVADAASGKGGGKSWLPVELVPELRKEWVRSVARTHTDLNFENRLISTMGLVDLLVSSLPIPPFEIQKGGGGNWDDKTIETMSRRLGFRLKLSSAVMTRVKEKVRNDLGPIGLVKALRNELAHGGISFVECAGEADARALRDIRNVTSAYMEGVLRSFIRYIKNIEFVVEGKRVAV